MSTVPIDAVLFDFHSTLVDQGAASTWLDLAWAETGRDGDPAVSLGSARAAELVEWADLVWERARELDPDSRRDLDPDQHRRVFFELVAEAPSVDTELARALYATFLDTWVPYDDAVPVLRALRDRGIRTGLVSNVGTDVTPVLDRAGLSEHLDAIVLSFEVGVAKPHRRIFEAAVDRLEVPAERTLMVGDSWQDDGGAAALGIRTLLLPRTRGPTHGLEAVLHLVG